MIIAHSSLRTRRARWLQGVVGIGCGAMAVAAFGISSGWWARSEDERIARMLLETNPESAANERRIEAAIAEAWAAPPLPRVEVPRLENPEPSPGTDSAKKNADPEWESLPRTKFVLSSTVEELDLAADRLFRNVHLNPADVHIRRHDREILAGWLPARLTTLRALRAAIHDVSVQELDYMIDRGVARSVSYREILSRAGPDELAALEKRKAELRQQLASLGASAAEIDQSLADLKVFNAQVVCAGAFGHATRAGDDRIFLGDLQRMPQSKNASQAYFASALELYFDVVGYFRRVGCLDEARESAILKPVEAPLARFRTL